MKLLLVLYTLTADPDPGTVGKLQHIAEKPVIISTLLDLTDKTAVDLDLIHLQTLEIAQGRISGSKIVNGNMHFLITPIREYIIKIIIILQLHTLCNFHCDISARKPCLSGSFHHIIYNRSLSQLHIGSVDTDTEILLQFPPSGTLGKCLLHHPLTYRNDHTALLQDRNKHNRRHKTKFPGMIAQQCLRTVKFIFIGCHLRLIIKLKSLKIVPDAVSHLLLKFNPGQGLVIILRREILHTVFARFFGTTQSIFRIADQYIYIFFLFKRIADNSCRKATQCRCFLLHQSIEILCIPPVVSHKIHCKMIPIQPVNCVSLTFQALQNLRAADQNTVAILTAHPLIHIPETVNSQNHQMSTVSPGNLTVQIIQHFIVIQQSGKHINLLSQNTPGETAHHHKGLMLMVLQHLTSGIDPILFAIAVQIAEVKIHGLFIAICNISQLSQNHLTVIGISHSPQIIYGICINIISHTLTGNIQFSCKMKFLLPDIPQEEKITCRLIQEQQHFIIILYLFPVVCICHVKQRTDYAP